MGLGGFDREPWTGNATVLKLQPIDKALWLLQSRPSAAVLHASNGVTHQQQCYNPHAGDYRSCHSRKANQAAVLLRCHSQFPTHSPFTSYNPFALHTAVMLAAEGA
jgi:hypothetical protein